MKNLAELVARPFATLAMLCALLSPTQADDSRIEGVASPAFQNAIELWLNDNDRDSLPELARLGRDGNEAARQFLWMLNFRGDLSTGWTESLPSKERRSFFKPRLPGSPAFGGWWAKDKEPLLVRMMRTAQLVPENTPNNIALMELGEPRLAFARLHPILGYKSLAEIYRIGVSKELPEPLLFFRYWANNVISDDLKSYSNLKIRKLHNFGSPMQRSLLFGYAASFGMEKVKTNDVSLLSVRELVATSEKEPHPLPLGEGSARLVANQKEAGGEWSGSLKSTLRWLQSSPLAEHLRSNCLEICADEADACLMTSYLAGGGFPVLYGHETVSERLLPSVKFRQSPRGKALPVRRIAWRMHYKPRSADRFLIDLNAASPCFAGAVGRNLEQIKTILKK